MNRSRITTLCIISLSIGSLYTSDRKSWIEDADISIKTIALSQQDKELGNYAFYDSDPETDLITISFPSNNGMAHKFMEHDDPLTSASYIKFNATISANTSGKKSATFTIYLESSDKWLRLPIIPKNPTQQIIHSFAKQLHARAVSVDSEEE